MNGYIQTLMGALGSLGFAILFNVRGKKLVYAAVGGVISWGCFLLLSPVVHSEAIRCLLSTTALTLYAQGMARVLKCPSTVLLVCG